MKNNQSDGEYQKNYKRINDLIYACTKAGVLDIDAAIKKATRDALKIKTEWKAINRGKIAIKLGYADIGECFLARAHELGTDGAVEFRDYKFKQMEKMFAEWENDKEDK